LTALFGVLRAAGVAALPLAIVLFGAAPALALAGARYGYRRGVRVGGSLVIAAFATLWLLERVAGHVVLRGALG
jgi:hypothetical protein